MTWPSVTIEQYNTFSSSPDGVENTLLFVGNAQTTKVRFCRLMPTAIWMNCWEQTPAR